MESSTSNIRNRPMIKFVRESKSATGKSSSSPVPQTVAKGKLPSPQPNHSEWTCTICLTTMSLKDATAHQQGRRHRVALAKIDKPLKVELVSDSLETGASDAQDTGVRGSNARAVLTAASSHTSRIKSDSVPPSSAVMEAMGCKTSSKLPREARKTKGKPTTKSKKKSKKIGPAPSVVDLQLHTERTGWFIDASRSDMYVDNPDYSICDNDCGWCGRCMGDMTVDFASMDAFLDERYQSISGVRSMESNDEDPLAAFFALYSPFRYNRASHSPDEYRRLCAFFGWPSLRQQEKHAERDRAWDGFRIAMVQAFNRTFGDDENDIEAWGRMCVLVGMEPIHDTLEARREAMLQTHVNLCDLLDTTRQRSQVQVFASEEDLRKYTLETRRVFPREDAYAGGLLKYLLREITGTYNGNRRPSESQKRKGRKPTKPRNSKKIAR